MHNLEIDEVYKKLNSRREGLNDQQVIDNVNKYGLNVLPKKKGTSFFKILFEEFLNPIVLLLVVTVIFSLIVGEVVDAIAIIFIIIIDLILGTFQEWKASKNADSLANIIKVKCRVIRNNKEEEIDSSELVLGDIVLLASGDKISADMRIIEAHNFTVNESVLTGESLTVNKDNKIIKDNVVLQMMHNTVFAGTTVVTGRAVAIVVKTGVGTEIGKIAYKVSTTKKEKSPLTIRMDKFSKQISILIIIIAILITILLISKGQDFSTIFLSVIALSVSAMPEGLPLALTMALTITSNKMLKKNVLVKKLNSVESLGSCTYIASDKTGTLTVNEQTAKKIILENGESFDIDGVGYNTIGKVIPVGNSKIEDAYFVSKLGYINNEAEIVKKGKKFNYLGDSIDIAFKVLGEKINVNCDDIEIIGDIPYESENKYSACFYKENNKYYCTVKGALEKIIEFCDDISKEKVLKQNEDLAKDGYRVIALASQELEELDYKDDYNIEDIPKLKFAGLVAFIDPVREEAYDAIDLCKKAGITTIMITGDQSLTAYSIAKDLKLCNSYDEVCDSEEFNLYKNKSQKEFDEFIKRKKVFSRVSPIDKLEIVESLKRSKEFVAVTGDGVNDTPALKSANIGIAMGSGTDVAKETADMIILDDSFKSIVEGVKEGRGAYSNIRKISFMLLSCGLAEVLFFCLAILFNLPMPLVAIQLLWLNVVTDGLQDIALSFEPTEDGVMLQKPIKTTETLFNKELFTEVIISGLTIGFIVFGVWKNLISDNIPVNIARGYIMTLMVFIQNIHVLNCRSEKESIFKLSFRNNMFVPLVIIMSILLQFIVIEVPVLSKILKTTSVPLKNCIELLLFSCIIIIVIEIYKLFKKHQNKNVS